ncbi:response regulator transcription factor [Sphingomonas sp. PAMC26645]|uniref:response regulator n=1 Tax=Sphingomonas sp. PAMC26645 TaxID=2565555 RepID=UPI00109D976D|nr:response regulator transcription factor [Sphingomonas sp. PAMC26645]QCB41161.1 response regulator transcription factor [Sphingomonas sp. PAMC26645]
MRLLVVEDHRELAGLVIERLARAGLVADWYDTVDMARLAIQAADYGAILLDLSLPDGDGLTLLRWLRTTGSEVPVLILTARSAVADRVAGLDAGADDYLVKPFATDELVARVQALLRRASTGHAMMWRCGRLAWDPRSQTGYLDDQPLMLPPRETQLLHLLLRDRGKVVRKGLIEANFFGLGDDFSSNAVEVSVHRLRRKLEATHAEIEIVTMRGIGYLLRATTA